MEFSQHAVGNAGRAQGAIPLAARKVSPLVFVLLWLLLIALAVPWDGAVAHWSDNGTVRRGVAPIFSFVEYLGGYSVQLLLLGILMAFPQRKRILTGYVAALLLCTALFLLIKYSVGRARPDMWLGPFAFYPLNFTMAGLGSFPSGHASMSMAVAELLGRYFPRSRRWFRLMAGFTALSRVFKLRHFLSDVVAGAGLGVVCVWLCVRWLGEEYYAPLTSTPSGKLDIQADNRNN